MTRAAENIRRARSVDELAEAILPLAEGRDEAATPIEVESLRITVRIRAMTASWLCEAMRATRRIAVVMATAPSSTGSMGMELLKIWLCPGMLALSSTRCS